MKSDVWRLMDNKEILFEMTMFLFVSNEDVSIITISANPSKVSSRKPVRATPIPKIAPLIITASGPIPYTSDKAIPWHYGADVYYHGVKQDLRTEEADMDISNIVGTSKVTRSRRLFSPEISPPTVHKPVVIPSASASTIVPVPTPVITPATETSGTRGKEIIGEPARMEAPKKIIVETSKQEIEEILKIIKKSDYNVVEQLGQTPSKISMLSLLLCSEAHAKDLIAFL